MVRVCDDVRLYRFEIRSVDRVLVAKAFDLLDQSRRGRTVDRSFPRRIDIEDEHNIRQVEGTSKIIEEMKRSCEAMRLEHGENALEVRALGGAERSPDCRRVMSIIVYHRDAVARLDLESPIDPFETIESCSDGRRLDAHVAASGKRGRCVQNVVHAGNIQPELVSRPAVESYGKGGTEAIESDVGDTDICCCRGTVGDDPALNLWNQ